ncbi:MAG: class I SAM-dependent methyltransferase [Anaerolineae bacterium]|nr:class I SAM-dependent methyltransferase [Anaerolineae bacterium]
MTQQSTHRLHVARRRLNFFRRYVTGNTPWDSGIVPPEITAWITAAQAGGIPPGRALDLGCGTGTTTIYLAEHGWDAVGIDFAPNAIWKARRKARQLDLPGTAHFHSADVSRLGFLSSDPPFNLAIDVGCMHSLAPDQRRRYAAHLARLTRPGTAYLLYAFLPRTGHHGQPIGIDPDGVTALFGPAFTLADHTLGEDVTGPMASGWYTLHRTDHVS